LADPAIWIGGFSCLLVAAVFLLPYWAIAPILLAVFLALAIIKLEWFLLAILLLRPLFDLAARRSAFTVGQTVSFEREQGNLAAGATLLLVVFCSLYLIRRRRTLWLPQPSRAFGAYLLVACISIFVSSGKLVSLAHFLRLSSILLLYLTLLDLVRTRKQFIRFGLAILASAIIPIALAIYQAVTGTGDHDTLPLNRVYGSFIHPNSLAYYLVVVLLLSLGLWSRRPSGIARASFTLFFLAALIALALTYTRGAWFAFACGLIVYAVSMRKKALLLWFGLVAVALAPLLSNRIESFWIPDPHYNSGLGRLLLWQDRIPLILARPVLGYGIGSTAEISEAHSAFSYVNHNDYIRVALETGFLGLLSFLFLLVSFTRDARNLLRKAHAPEGGAMAAALFGSAIAYAIASFGENLLTQLAFQWYLWSLAAIAYSAVRLTTRSNPPERRGQVGLA
jgi:O-antigen ligase